MSRLMRLMALSVSMLALLIGAAPVAAAPDHGRVVGHVYVNDNRAVHNTISGFDRHPDGSLTPIAGSPFATGGAGIGSPTGSAGAIQETADGRFILAVDAGSDQISVLRIGKGGTLSLVPGGVHASNGHTPLSLTVHGDLVYVANGGAGGSDYTGFRLGHDGRLQAIPGSTVALPDDALPGHILFSGDGRRLVATRVGPNAGPSFIDSFSVGHDGLLTAAPGSPYAAQGIGPFGSAFRPTNPDQLFVSNAHDGAGNGTVSAYHVGRDGALSPVAGSPFADLQTAPCWVAVSPDGRWLFAVNTAVPSISSYSIARDGRLSLAGSTPFKSPTGLRPFDAAVDPSGRFLYVTDAGAATISAFAIHGGVLTELPPSPIAIPSGGAPFGIVVD